jgi:hypothetical protein
VPEQPTRRTAEELDAITSTKGWLRPVLFAIEAQLNGRWAYWQAIRLNGTIGPADDPTWEIPKLTFTANPASASGAMPTCLNAADLPAEMLELIGGPATAWRHLQSVLDPVFRDGQCRLDDVIEWLLWAFGSRTIETRPVLPPQAVDRLYHDLQLERLVANPADWGSLMVMEWGAAYGRQKYNAWFPTPLHVVELMTCLTFGNPGGDEDLRRKTFNDPCAGTGVMLLCASNYSLRLSACDIDRLMCLLCELAGWLYIPWLVMPSDILIAEFQADRFRSMISNQDTLRTSPKIPVPEETKIPALPLFT